MYRKILISGLIIIFVSQFWEDSEAKEKVEFKLVKEWEFEKKIQDVAFGETKDGKLYPKIIVLEDEIKFYEKSGQTGQMAFPKGTTISLSPKGKYFGIDQGVKKASTHEAYECKKCFTLFDYKIQEKATIRYKVGYEGEGDRVFEIRNDGSFIEIDYGNQILFLRDVGGKLKKKIVLFDKSDWSQWGVAFKYSESEEYFAVVGVNIYRDTEEDWQHDFYVLLFNSDGEEIWRKLLKSGQEHMIIYPEEGLFISSHGNYVLAAGAYNSYGREFILVDRNGDILGKYQGAFAKFSDDERYVVICTRNTVQLVQTCDGNIVWAKEFPWNIDSRQEKCRWFNSVDLSADSDLICASSISHKRYRNRDGSGGSMAIEPEIVLLNREGKMLCEKRDSSVKGKVFLKVSSVGTEIIIRKINVLSKFEYLR